MPDRFAAGVRLAVTTFTVAPVRAGRVDRPAAAVAMSLAPAVGAVLGAVLAGALLGLAALGAPPLVAGTVAVGLSAALTRGLHLDGLADTADALGSYRPAEAALAVMRRPDVGPFGVVALVLVLVGQAAALGELATPAGRAWTAVLAAVVAATAAGRLAAAFACRRGVPPARTEGLGALVAGTVGPGALAAGAAAVAVLAVPAVPGRPWQGPAAVLGAVAVAVLWQRHAVRRLGGVTGDVLGASVEGATTLAYVGLLLT